MKTCTACKVSLPLDKFYKRTASIDGLAPRCISCLSAHSKLVYVRNREKILKQMSDKYQADRSRILAYQKGYYRKNAEVKREAARVYSAKNRELITAKRKNYRSQYRKDRLAIHCEYSMKRYAMKRRATSANMDIEKIRSFYIQANIMTTFTGIVFNVDHIVPIISPIVCGLHNHFNLQVITATENQIKSNRVWPDMP